MEFWLCPWKGMRSLILTKRACSSVSRSMSFTLCNGVRQGGMLSPILSTVYLGDLLNELKLLCRCGLPLHRDITFWCIKLYADDIAVLAPLADAMRQILRSVRIWLPWMYGPYFNPTKTQLIHFARSPLPYNICISIYDEPLSLVHSAIHLGVGIVKLIEFASFLPILLQNLFFSLIISTHFAPQPTHFAPLWPTLLIFSKI